MARVYFTIPSARPAAEAAGTFLEWKRRGYGLAIWRDANDELTKLIEASSGAEDSKTPLLLLVGKYPGYALAVNALMQQVFSHDPECNWCVAGGDDTHPDKTTHPDMIALQLESHFGGTYGVMQPTGDRWADGSIDRIAGSPWVGREWARRAHRGTGPFFYRFQHMAVDEGLLWVAEREGRYLRRQDLTHHHNHWGRTQRGGVTYDQRLVPPHLKWANTPEHWIESRKIIHQLKREYDQMWSPIP